MAKSVSLRQISKLGKFSPKFGGNISQRNGIFIRGTLPLIGKFGQLGKIMPSKALDGLTKALLIVEAEAVRLVTSGYYRPAVDTGRMRRAITHTVTNFSPNRVEGVVGLSVFYAIYVHEGTIYMEKRPFLTDALKNKQIIIRAILVDTFKGGFKQFI